MYSIKEMWKNSYKFHHNKKKKLSPFHFTLQIQPSIRRKTNNKTFIRNFYAIFYAF